MYDGLPSATGGRGGRPSPAFAQTFPSPAGRTKQSQPLAASPAGVTSAAAGATPTIAAAATAAATSSSRYATGAGIRGVESLEPRPPWVNMVVLPSVGQQAMVVARAAW